MKGAVKARTVDKYLYPIRLQIIELVGANSTVLELGCGNGDLLFKLSHKIKLGKGIDNSKQLIAYANQRMEQQKVTNLDFKKIDVLNESYLESRVDYAVTSLLLHILPWDKSIETVQKLVEASNTTIICGFSRPKNKKQKFLLWLDQRFTGHYPNFKYYKENGYTEGLLNSIKNIKYESINTFDPVIKIYKVTKGL